MSFTFAWIRHNPIPFQRYLEPSLQELLGDFKTLSANSGKPPAIIYNDFIQKCDTDWLILLHADIDFPSTLLNSIQQTIQLLNQNEKKIGALAAVGRDRSIPHPYRWSSNSIIYELDTADCCFLAIQPSVGVQFDSSIFDGFHLYVEDYCAQLNRKKDLGVWTILIDSEEGPAHWNPTLGRDKLRHHSFTMNAQGAAWGDYHNYKNKLIKKWGKIQTT